MKFTCQRQDIVNAINMASKAVSPKPQTPILSGMFLRAEEGKLEVQATDYEIGILYDIPADIETPGTIVLPGRYLQEVVRRLPDDRVLFSLDEKNRIVHIRSGNANYTLRSMNAGDYPGVKRIEGTLSFTIPDTVLRSLFRKTVFACATDDSRPIFTGVSFDFDGKKLTLAGTNTHRLAVKTKTFDDEIGKLKLIVPGKTLQELLRTFTSDVPTNVQITCSMNQISFQYENLYFTSRLIEGAFPSFANVIPRNTVTTVTMTTADLSAAMDRVFLISRTNDYNVMKLHFGDNNLHISSSNPDIGMADEDIPATIAGPDIDIAFNATYLVDALKVLEGETCTFALTKPLAPVLITEPNDPEFQYVVTPMRTH
ncbi:DNA polymerase III subunit beta [uncultured Selenomonas sp.]|uniref:DNA polymerase III subunit beta n=1 Tax=uncultured Selenomonas sp. TaxID=159275 RepID=UPI0025EE0B27|nr:DNA polymerase III subunit beta [uncultured Selenomonas sp.]